MHKGSFTLKAYVGKRVLVTGGLGFIGSNLAARLLEAGARVTVVDACIPGCGGNLHNLAAISRDIQVARFNIADAERVRPLLERVDVIFNLAGEISHRHSMDYPERDLDINARSQLLFLRECARQVPGVRIVYTSTRQVYGRPEYLPVDESHPIAPVDYNGVSKFAASQYHLMLTRDGLLDAAILRLTNTYGPRLAVNVPCQGVLSVFFMRLLLGLPIEIFGDGLQSRDPLYVDDAVEALLVMGAVERLPSRIYNIGGPKTLPLAEIATALCRLAGAVPPRYRPFPNELRAIDIGSYSSDSRRIRQDLGWTPKVALEDGAGRTLEFFRQRLGDYLDVSKGSPECPLPQPAMLEKAPVPA
jgi:nucleoside-diphosphate-sugar epimerase